MSEVDRLSISGTYPALPIPGKRQSRRDGREAPPPAPPSESTPAAIEQTVPKPPKSLIDEYV
jgi:hypothetical protein